MAAEFGKLLYLSDKKDTDDPYKGEMMVPRLGTMDRPDVFYFNVPEDKRSLKLDECRFAFDLDVPDNYVPDNSLHAKVIRRVSIAFNDQRVFDSFDLNEYTMFNHAKVKLNESDDAQDLELFPSGHFDCRELDGDELKKDVDEDQLELGKKEKLVRNGLSIIENRQQYAEKIWQKGEQKISFSSDANAGQYDYERLVHRYSIRAPISHGIASQRRVIPSGVKTLIEVELNTAPHYLMEVDSYQTCRTAIENFTAFKWPFHPSLKTKTITIDHLDPTTCDCAKRWPTGEYEKVEEIFEDTSKRPNTSKQYIEKIIDTETKEGGKYKFWKKHRVDKKTALSKLLKVPHPRYPDDEEKSSSYLEFYWQNIIPLAQTPALHDFMLQSVFVNPGKKELPLTTGEKGVAAIPFFYQKLIAKPFPMGRSHATINVSTGVLPHMLFITGMPHDQYAHPNFNNCTTKTTLNNPNFKIVEFTIFVNNRPQFRTPWRHPMDHYANYLKHNGRYENKGLGGGIDFFKFQDENWLVPLIFDDSAGLTGSVDVHIVFDRPIEANWDLLVMAVPVEDLEIDMINKSKN